MIAGTRRPPDCPLCGGRDPVLFHRDGRGTYWRCLRCALVFVPSSARPDPASEKARYDQHRNDPGDPAYRAFLSRLANPLLERVPEGAEGLDFGCGPGPVLAAMLTEAGRPTACYDPFYAPDESVWRRTWSFITASEVLEHLHRPAEELDRLFDVLEPGGWLGIMTRPPPDAAAFAGWRYRRDPTHVCFYARPAFLYIARRWRAAPTFVGSDVVLLQRSR